MSQLEDQWIIFTWATAFVLPFQNQQQPAKIALHSIALSKTPTGIQKEWENLIRKRVSERTTYQQPIQ